MRADDGEAILVVLTCCDAHLDAVKAFQRRFDDALVAPIEALPAVLQDLGSDAWTAAAATA